MNKKKGSMFTIISTDKSYSQIGTFSKITWYKYTGSTIIIKAETVHVLTLFFSLLHKQVFYTKVAFFKFLSSYKISEFWVYLACVFLPLKVSVAAIVFL